MDIAAQRSGVKGHSDLARLFDIEPSVVTNWKSRGVPHRYAVAAQKLWGVSPLWIVEGIGEQDKGGGEVQIDPSPKLLAPSELTELITLYAACDPHGRKSIMTIARLQASESLPVGTDQKQNRS
jgi:hypothetical protein